MPSIQRETSVPANSVIDNIFSGSAFEYMRGNGIVSLGVTAQVTGTFITIQSGPDVILEESPPQVLAGSMPIVPDHFYYNWGAAAGDRLLLRIRNPTGAAVIHRSICNIQYQ